MLVKEYLLLVFPIYGEVNKLSLSKYGLKSYSLSSSKFSPIHNDPAFGRLGKDVKTLLTYISSHNLEENCIIISTRSDYNNLWLLYNLLKIIMPSNLHPIAEITVTYKIASNRKSIWQIASVTDYKLNFDYAFDQPLFLSNYTLVNTLLDAFNNLSKRTALHQLLVTYFEAVNDTKPHAKLIFLMMLVETLMGNDKEAGINYKIRRTCAVFLGEDYEMSKQIYTNVNKIYTARSALIHNASFKSFTPEMIVYLHLMVCEILNTLLLSNIPYKNVFEIVNEYGYGERKFLLADNGLKKDKRFIRNRAQLLNKIKNP